MLMWNFWNTDCPFHLIFELYVWIVIIKAVQQLLCCTKSGVGVFVSEPSKKRLTRHSCSGKHGRFGHVIQQGKCHAVVCQEVYISSDFIPHGSLFDKFYPSLVFNMLGSYNINSNV